MMFLKLMGSFIVDNSTNISACDTTGDKRREMWEYVSKSNVANHHGTRIQKCPSLWCLTRHVIYDGHISDKPWHSLLWGTLMTSYGNRNREPNTRHVLFFFNDEEQHDRVHQLTLCSSSKPCQVFHKSVHQTRCFRKVTRPALSWKDATRTASLCMKQIMSIVPF